MDVSPSYAYLRINLIPLRYPLVIIPSRDNLNWGIKHWPSKMPTSDIEIKRERLIKVPSSEHIFRNNWVANYKTLAIFHNKKKKTTRIIFFLIPPVLSEAQLPSLTGALFSLLASKTQWGFISRWMMSLSWQYFRA